jgi:hypothetical protein
MSKGSNTILDIQSTSIRTKYIATLFLKGIRDDCLDVLNLMGVRDVSQLSYNTICELCRQYSRGNNKGRGSQEILSRVSKSSGGVPLPELKLGIC